MRLWVAGVQFLEGITHAAVQLHASSRRKLPVESVADQQVRKTEPTGLGRHVYDDALARSFVEDLEELITAHIAYSLERREVELAPQHRGENQDEPAVLREVPQPPLDHCSHPYGHHPPPRFRARDRFECVFGREQPDQLSGKERVPVSCAMKRARKCRRRLESSDKRDEAGEIGLTESAKRERTRDGLASKLGQRPGQ